MKILAQCPVCRSRVNIKRTRSLVPRHAPPEWFEENKRLVDLVVRGTYRDYRSNRQFIHWACNGCLDSGAALLANPREQKYYSCPPYFAYFTVKFLCDHCDTEFLFAKEAQRERYEVEKKWVQVWPQYCRVCKGRGVRARLRYVVYTAWPKKSR